MYEIVRVNICVRSPDELERNEIKILEGSARRTLRAATAIHFLGSESPFLIVSYRIGPITKTVITGGGWGGRVVKPFPANVDYFVVVSERSV